ncbi:early nodulin-like protein 18 [Magnolia sinica]|uniref:early nodulin-like protein 18 n=1 Tax=Magnolia sinica TaxID=86752 RepID=UPI00265843CD|nr:early nodulin-like protein 18 [Magnolia sinica]
MVHLPLIITVLIATASVATSSDAPPYTNHTVGGQSGWFFNLTTSTPSANYSSWAANQTFNLGDYLIFNTNTNQTVIQTYNETTYKSCTTDEDSGDETFVFFGSQEIGKPAMVAVPLTIEGVNYYFSDADDGTQCDKGMGFEIMVGHGRGLPPSLNQPPPPPYVAPPMDSPPSDTVTTNQGQTFYNGGSGIRVRFGMAVLLLLFSSGFLLQ